MLKLAAGACHIVYYDSLLSTKVDGGGGEICVLAWRSSTNSHPFVYVCVWRKQWVFSLFITALLSTFIY